MYCCRNKDTAAENGHLECIKKLHSEEVKWSFYITSILAGKGYLECLEYLHSQGCEWTPSTTCAAAGNGNLECLKYLHEQGGCEWHSCTTYYASLSSKLECLFYCLENNCPIHPYTLNFLYEKQINDNNNLITNVLLRKILLHSRLKKQITSDKYPKFIKAIDKYQQFKNKFYELVESECNLPIDVIKYEIMKYI